MKILPFLLGVVSIASASNEQLDEGQLCRSVFDVVSVFVCLFFGNVT